MENWVLCDMGLSLCIWWVSFEPEFQCCYFCESEPGRVAQSVGHLTRNSGVLGSIPGLATYFRFSFHFFKKGSCQLLAKVCARSTGLPLSRYKPAQEKRV